MRGEKLTFCLQDLRAVDGKESLLATDRDAGLVDHEPLDETRAANVDLRHPRFGWSDERSDSQRPRRAPFTYDGRPHAYRLDAIERQCDRCGPRRNRARSGDWSSIVGRCRWARSLGSRADDGRGARCARSRSSATGGDGLEGHVTDRTLTGLVRNDLRVHRAVVLRSRLRSAAMSMQLCAGIRPPHEDSEERGGSEQAPSNQSHDLHSARRRFLTLDHRIVISGHRCLQ